MRSRLEPDLDTARKYEFYRASAGYEGDFAFGRGGGDVKDHCLLCVEQVTGGDGSRPKAEMLVASLVYLTHSIATWTFRSVVLSH